MLREAMGLPPQSMVDLTDMFSGLESLSKTGRLPNFNRSFISEETVQVKERAAVIISFTSDIYLGESAFLPVLFF